MYAKQTWVDEVTPADAAHMQHIEDGLEAAASVADSAQALAAAALPVPAGVNGQFLKKVGGVWVPSTFSEADLGLTDVVTGDVSTARHGLVPKAPNDTTKFLRGDGAWAKPAGGLIVIDDLVVAGAALASYDTNTRLGGNIPGTYKDLILVITGKATAMGDLNVQINGVTTGYYSERLLASAAATSGQERLNTTVFEAAPSFGTGSGGGNYAEITFPNYTDTTFQRLFSSNWFVSQNNSTGTLQTGRTGGMLLGSSAAVTRIVAAINGSTFQIATRITLYGRS